MKRRKATTRVETWFLLVAGLILGTVFTVGMHDWNAPVSREEATYTTAVYQSCRESRNRYRSSIREMIIRFEDHEQLYIDGACIDETLQDRLHGLAPGTELTLLVHPDSDTILELRVGNFVWLAFRDAEKALKRETTGFLALGLLCYAGAAYGLAWLLIRKRDRG